jgi:CPA1 family monovalent cation:H+ antiporter
MDFFAIISILTTMAALFAYLNTRFLKLPFTIGLMILAMVFTSLIIGIGHFVPSLLSDSKAIIASLDFKSLLLDVMLSFLLFAGALHTKLDSLSRNRGPILLMATLGVLLSACLIGLMVYGLLWSVNYPVDLIYCFLFGSLLAPTDPIAVLSILKEAKAPKKLEVKIVGESLFNDGIGVVVFLVLLALAKEGIENVSFGFVAHLFLAEVGGGLLLGFVGGYLAFRLMRSIDHYETEVMITLAVVMGLYSLALALHFSGPLAVVIAGLFIGNKSPKAAWSKTSQAYIDKFWELLDVFLNAILFVLIGLELLIVEINSFYLLLGLAVIPIALLARYLSVLGPVELYKKRLDFVPKTAILLTWGGIRGGISIALALSVESEMHRELFLSLAYVVVVFSIIVQGLSLGPLLKKLLK